MIDRTPTNQTILEKKLTESEGEFYASDLVNSSEPDSENLLGNITSDNNVSFWFSSVLTPITYEKLSMDVETDILVIGGGIAGFSTAYNLAKEGLKVILVEDGFVGSGEMERTTAHLSNALDDRYFEHDKLFDRPTAKLTADESVLNKILDGKVAKEDYIHEALINPHFYILSGGTPTLTNSVGNPWSASYIIGIRDLTADLSLNISAETIAKMVYENLMKFTDDVLVKKSLRFLMTREVAHFQMFQAALDSIQPNFPPGILQSDPKYSNKYFNMSKSEDFKGAWNEGISPEMNEEWQ